MKIDISKIKESKTTEELLKFGIINIDKPTGPTSFSVSHFVKKMLNLNKTSHMGTLDPMVTGVLPVALSRACRLNEYLMHRDKEYIGIMRLHEDISDTKLKEEMKKFIGKINQLPPVKSRVKREIREREIKRFEIIERDGKDVLFISDVQAGTYIRKLISDLGEKIGGAHMLELRRTRAGAFSENDKEYPSVKVYDFEKAVEEYKKGNDKDLRRMIVPGEIVTTLIPVFEISRDFVKKALTGSPIFPSALESGTKVSQFKKDDKACAFSEGKIIGCYRIVNDSSVFAVPEFVLN